MATERRRRSRFSYIMHPKYNKNKVVPIEGVIHSLDPVASVKYAESNPSFESNIPMAMRMSSEKIVAKTTAAKPIILLSAQVVGTRPRKTMTDWIFRRTRKSPGLDEPLLPQLLAKPTRRGGKRKSVKKRNRTKKNI